MAWTNLAFSFLLLFVGHVIRAVRWQLLTSPFMTARLGHYVMALTVGYTASLLLPFRLGELVRIGLFSHLTGVRLAHATSSVFLDRLSDVWLVMLLLGLAVLGQITPTPPALLALLAVLGIPLFVVMTLTRAALLRRFYTATAGLFNPTLQRNLLAAAWANQHILEYVLAGFNPLRFAMLSLLMWGCYGLSIYAFAQGLPQPLAQGLQLALHLYGGGQSTTEAFLHWLRSPHIVTTLLGAYLALSLVPPLLTMLYLALVSNTKARWVVRGASTFWLLPFTNRRARATKLNLYLDPADELAFLTTWAAGRDQTAVLKAYQHNRDVAIIRNLSGGSLATVMLAEKNGSRFFRKYATGDEAARLKTQMEWLQTHQATLPVTPITSSTLAEGFTSFDMPYHPEAQSMFDYIHSHAPDTAWQLLETCLTDLHIHLHQPTQHKGDKVLAEAYLREKLLGSLERTLRAAPRLEGLAASQELIVNGTAVPNLLHQTQHIDTALLAARLNPRLLADIFGDLTVENIIHNPAMPHGYYLIDPSGGHVFPSQLLDYAKLRQSLAGGYEFLTRLEKVQVQGNRIQMPVTVSQTYNDLAHRLDRFIQKTHGPAALEETRLHTLVHWCRLLPYRAKHQPQVLEAYLAVGSRLAQEAGLFVR